MRRRLTILGLGLAVGAGLLWLLMPPPRVVKPRLPKLAERMARVAGELRDLGYVLDLDDVQVERRAPTMGYEPTPSAWKSQATSEDAARAFFLEKVLGYDITPDPYPDIGGYYAPWRRTIAILDWGHGGWEERDELLAHELLHVHQHMVRGAFSQASYRNPTTREAANIARCITEGDADLALIRLRLRRRGLGVDSVDPDALDVDVDQGVAGTAAALPYTVGRRFLLRAVHDQGLGALDKVYNSPPVSTEQILHPEKRGKDRPGALPWYADISEGLVFEAADTIGELGIHAWVADTSGRDAAARVATGWDADEVRIYRQSGGDRVAIWLSLWDREKDAEDFRAHVSAEGRAVCRRVGRTVVCVRGGDPAGAATRASAIAGRLASPPLVASDAESTRRAESGWARRFQAPRVEEGVWILPMLGVSVPLPPGWEQRRRGGVAFCARRDAGAETAERLTLRTEPTGDRMTRGQIRARLERMHAAGVGEHVIRVEDVTVDGAPAVLAERAIGYQATWYSARTLSLYVPRTAGLLVVAAAVPHEYRERSWAGLRKTLLGVTFPGRSAAK